MSISNNVILSVQGDAVRVYHDPEDTQQPCALEISGEKWWLHVPEVQRIIAALQRTIGADAADSRVAANDITLNEALMRLAALHGREVEFSYAKGAGALIEKRRLRPSDVREVSGHMTFTGYDPDRDEPRAYRTDRIKGEVTIR